MKIILLFIIIELGQGFKDVLVTTRFSSALFYKNPDYEKKRREQRRSKRLKQVLPEEQKKTEKQMQAIIRKSKSTQYKVFGQRLSQVPGDGGKIPNLNRSGDNYNVVKEYYQGFEGDSENFKDYREGESEMINEIIKNHYKTLGEFKDEEPLIKKTFYKPFQGYFPESKFEHATLKKTISTVKRTYEEVRKGTQAYWGLKVEGMFKHLSPKQMDVLRQKEIMVKRGLCDPDNPLFYTKDNTFEG